MWVRYPWIVTVWQVPRVWLPPEIQQLRIPYDAERTPAGDKGAVFRAAWLHWRGYSPGLVVMDSDIAIEPDGVATMERYIAQDEGCVWAAPYRLWEGNTVFPPGVYDGAPGDAGDEIVNLVEPDAEEEWLADNRDHPDRWFVRRPDGRLEMHTKGRPDGVWAHRVFEPDTQSQLPGRTLRRCRWGRLDDDRIDRFGFGCTYVPHAVWERIESLGLWPLIRTPHADTNTSRIACLEPAIPARLAREVRVMHLHYGSLTSWRKGAELAGCTEQSAALPLGGLDGARPVPV
jgi:hypothetical protein